MSTCWQRVLMLAGMLSLLLPPSARAQTFTNSATLNAALDGTGTNLVVRYSLMNTQGWVTLFQAGSLTDLATNAQPFDLAPAPGSGQGQFTVPVNPAAPSQFYRLLLEQWPSRGKALVWTNGPLDFAAMRATYGDITNLPVIAGSNCYTGYGCSPFYTNATTPSIFNPPVQVWIDNLGTYDTNGVLVGGNTNYLQGKYATTWIYSMNNASVGFPQINPILSTNNDFRVNHLSDTNVDPRTALLWSSQVQLYHDINDYRNRFFNDAFIDELNLPTNIAANVKQYQFRPDLNMGSPPRLGVPVLEVYEDVIPIGLRQAPIGNNESVWARTRGPYRNYPTLPPVSFCYDAGVTIGDYVGLMAFWVLGAKTGFPGDNFYGQINTWPTGVLAPINKGLSTWTAYRYAGDPEVFRYNQYAERVWSGAFFGGSGIPGDKGNNIRNVMMFDEQNLSEDGVFPYTPPSGLTGTFGPVSADLAGMYVAAIFYDIANDAGLGLHKTDLLFWKTLSVITAPPTNYTMRQFGASIQQAARLLWPDPRPVNAGLSLYENDLVDVLTSRGIPLNGVSDFRTNLPPPIGPLNTPTAFNFASKHPNTQPSVNLYNNGTVGLNGYTMTNTGTTYMALQLYKHSKYGPCDELDFTDGTFNSTNGLFNYNTNGTYYCVLQDRDPGNVILLVPGNTVSYRNYRLRCPNEATGFYAEDVQAFGFIVTKGTPNGFSFTVTNLSATATNKTYRLSIVDPSLTTLGAASYAWSFTNYDGTFQTVTGTNVQYTALKDQPFTLSIARTRASKTDTLTLRERGNDLDRNGGNEFVRNLVP